MFIFPRFVCILCLVQKSENLYGARQEFPNFRPLNKFKQTLPPHHPPNDDKRIWKLAFLTEFDYKSLRVLIHEIYTFVNVFKLIINSTHKSQRTVLLILFFARDIYIEKNPKHNFQQILPGGGEIKCLNLKCNCNNVFPTSTYNPKK